MHVITMNVNLDVLIIINNIYIMIDKIRELYKELKQRYNSESPILFVKIKKITFKIGASALAVITINSAVSLDLNTMLITILSYIVAMCAAINSTASLTVVDKDKEDK